MAEDAAVTSSVYRGDCQRGEIEILEEGSIFRNAYVEVFNDRVRFPNLSEGTSFRWRWAAPYGVIVLPILPDGRVLLIELFRHTERGWRLEAPRGFGSSSESPAEAARREVCEETGYADAVMIPVRQIGSADYPVHLFLAQLAPQDAEPCWDQDESIRATHRFTAAELPALLMDPRIHDAETLFLLSGLAAQRL